MSPYFQNIRDNRRLEAKHEGGALRKRAKAIHGQDDADAATVELHADAETACIFVASWWRTAAAKSVARR